MLPAPVLPFAAPAIPSQTTPSHGLPYRASPERAAPKPSMRMAGRAEALRATVCGPSLAAPRRAAPCHAVPCPARPWHDCPRKGSRESQGPPCCRLQPLPNHAMPDPASPGPTPPNPALPRRAGTYTASGCPGHQAAASKATISASNLPCLGRQSPTPTSLPASEANCVTSRRSKTSGS